MIQLEAKSGSQYVEYMLTLSKEDFSSICNAMSKQFITTIGLKYDFLLNEILLSFDHFDGNWAGGMLFNADNKTYVEDYLYRNSDLFSQYQDQVSDFTQYIPQVLQESWMSFFVKLNTNEVQELVRIQDAITTAEKVTIKMVGNTDCYSVLYKKQDQDEYIDITDYADA